MKAKWICSLFTAFLFSWNGFAEEGVPCPESPQTAPSAPSTSTPSGSDSPASTPPSTGPTTGGDPTTVKDQVGLTLNPDGGAKGGSVTDPNLVGVDLPKVTNFGLIYGNDIAAKYLQLWEQMLQLNKAKEDAATNEKVRRASWERNSGLNHARDEVEKSKVRLSEARKHEEKANEAYDKAISDYADWDRSKFRTDTRLKNAEVGSKEWYDMIEENMQLDKQKPALEEARQNKWDKVLEARKETGQLRQEMRSNMERADTALENYKNMEANYRASRDASIPKPQE